MPHHGGKNTIDDQILNKINPKQAIISVGENYYGHPNIDIINLLDR
ncbi:MAG TPA: hypothetical protein P5052_01085 [Candidatus Paceibacterota bacterium]|nr:hypothetical protein [Candidatus Paceibacterota bacterium]HRZ29374.1 hypothetical protein [Candidatus Paceibacterota bacterium]